MAGKYPKDRFDVIPDDLHRVGAHRAVRRRGRGWIPFGWALLATVVLVAAGVFWMFSVNNSVDFNGIFAPGSKTPSVTATPTPTVVPTVDPSLNVTVLNGTPTAGLAASVGDELVAKGWNVTSRANASTTEFTQTMVYYADESLKGAALGIAAELPGSVLALTQDFVDSGAALTVVIGSDYQPAP
ncbi:MAG: LytR C-terminal domain-containing protein [Microbacteriaceae bacterium]